MKTRMHHGFTLVELLVSLVVVAILISLVFVGLKQLRAGARSTSDLSKLRSFGQGFTLYSQDFREAYPYFTNVGFMTKELSGEGVPPFQVSHFDASEVWHVVLARKYFADSPRSEAFYPASSIDSRDSQWPFRTTFRYACVFIATPEYWRPETRLDGSGQFGVTRISSVTRPSLKTLIVRGWTSNDGEVTATSPISSLLCDGSTRQVAFTERRSGYDRGCGNPLEPFGAIHRIDSPPLLHTLLGVQGQDIDPVAK